MKGKSRTFGQRYTFFFLLLFCNTTLMPVDRLCPADDALSLHFTESLKNVLLAMYASNIFDLVSQRSGQVPFT